MSALEHLQGDWWWSYVEDATAGYRWLIDGEQILENGVALDWTATPKGVRVKRPHGRFILIEPTGDDMHVAHLYVAKLGLGGFEETGSLVPYAKAVARGWTPGDRGQVNDDVISPNV